MRIPDTAQSPGRINHTPVTDPPDRSPGPVPRVYARVSKSLTHIRALGSSEET